ncbi:hypothetical protein DYB28_001246 [Aphanomyces astaci]|uniref:Uncharacterized protein n=1 Tax=Aphanomyces astaci TaxID=112090 RepID=A0A9X8E2X5_APHAT|nr:hypothetical protein DYB28_001246 [Aphanomyces astaci]
MGIPRLIDLGHWNNSYSAVLIALALQWGINDLPLSIVLSYTSPIDKRTAPKGRRFERLKPFAVTEQDGAETEEVVPTAELAMFPTSGTSSMQLVEDETKEENPSPNKASDRSAPHSMPKSLEGGNIELYNYDDEKTDLARHQERQQAAKASQGS